MARTRVRGRRRKRRVRINGFRLIISVIIIMLLIVFALSIHNVIKLKKEQGELIRQNEALQQKKAQLEEELASVNDKSYIEEQARKRLKLIKPGEILYILDDENAEKTND